MWLDVFFKIIILKWKSFWNNYFLSLFTYHLVKKICLDIVSDQSEDFVGHGPMTDSYLQLFVDISFNIS